MKSILLFAFLSTGGCQQSSLQGAQVQQSLSNISKDMSACPELVLAIDAVTSISPVVQYLTQQAKENHDFDFAYFEHDSYLLDHLLNNLKAEVVVHGKGGAITCEDAKLVHELCNRLNRTKDNIAKLVKDHEEHSTYWFRSKFVDDERKQFAEVAKDYEQFKEHLVLLETNLSSKIMHYEDMQISAFINASRQQSVQSRHAEAYPGGQTVNGTTQMIETLRQGASRPGEENNAVANATRQTIERLEREFANTTQLMMEKAIDQVNNRIIDSQPSRLYTVLWVCAILTFMWLVWNLTNSPKVPDRKNIPFYGAV